MHVWGSPLHAFDRTKLANGRIVVRRARPGEELRTLDGTLRRLDADDLLITDGERPVALAAIMGGEDSEVTDDTREVLLEAANFEPLGILRSSERLALRTPGSNRWEKGVDPYLAENAAVLASRLLVDLAGARMTGHVDVQRGLPEQPGRPLPSRSAPRASSGSTFRHDEQRATLDGFGFDVSDEWDVDGPDLARARRHPRGRPDRGGRAAAASTAFPHTLPLRRHVRGRLTKEQRLRRVVEDALVGAGLSEAYTWSLVAADPSPDAIRLPNPMTSDQAILRTTIVPGPDRGGAHGRRRRRRPRRALRDRTGLPPVRRAAPDERWRVAGVVEAEYEVVEGGARDAVRRARASSSAFERGSHALLHPGKAAETEAGWLGELHPRSLDGVWGAFELDLETLFDAVAERVVYEDVVTYPATLQDIAVAVDEEVEVGALVDAAREAAGELLREARVFDVYRGDQVGAGRKSVAIHLAFQSPERTLTEEEATAARERIVDALAERFGAELRA